MSDLRYGAAGDAGRLHSGFWGNCPIEAILKQLTDGFYFFDDFKQGGAAESTTVFAWTGGSPPMRYKAHGTASSLIKMLQGATDDEIGVLTLDADRTTTRTISPSMRPTTKRSARSRTPPATTCDCGSRPACGFPTSPVPPRWRPR